MLQHQPNTRAIYGGKTIADMQIFQGEMLKMRGKVKKSMK
jgi:hypothetical protein